MRCSCVLGALGETLYDDCQGNQPKVRTQQGR